MPYTTTWDSAFEASPANTANISEGDDRIRELKVSVRERMAKDHYMDTAGTDADHGEHQKITFNSQIVKPTNVANKGFLYIKDVSAKVELFWEDEDGNEVQLSAAGSLNAFPSGTKMVFYQDTAPAGWTLDTTLNDKLLFITKGSGAGGQTGGGVHSTGSWTITGMNADSHVLTTAEIPPHIHSMTIGFRWGGFSVEYPGIYDTGGTGSSIGYTNSSGGSGGGHTHTCTHTPGWRPAAYCAIIASKN